MELVLALGLAAALAAKDRPAVRLVLAKDGLSPADIPGIADISVIESFEITTVPDDRSRQLADFAGTVSARMKSLAPDLVVVRRADTPTRASNKEGPRVRLLVDGAITAAARLINEHTVLRTGREIGAAFGSSKDAVEAAAAGLVQAKYVEAAAAALAGLVADRY